MGRFSELYNRYMSEANYCAVLCGLDQANDHNGEWDAFRHAYVSGEMTREYGSLASDFFGYMREGLVKLRPAGNGRTERWCTVVRALMVWLAVLAWGVPTKAQTAGPSDWLDRLFPSVANCTPPEPFFYDEKSGKSVPGTLEARGYTARRVMPDVAEYEIDERFHGLHATSIQIPNHMAVVDVTMDVPVDQAKATLEQAFRESIAIYPAENDRPGVAYLYSISPGQTVFICSSEPE